MKVMCIKTPAQATLHVHERVKAFVRKFWLVVPLLLCGFLAATAQAADTPTDASKGSTKRNRPSENTGLLVDKVVAVVNDEIVLRSELMMRVAPLAYELERIQDVRERKRRQAKLAGQVLEEMVNELLVGQSAETAKLTVSDKEVDAAISDLKEQNKLDDDQLQEALRMQGYTMASYRKDVRNQILRMRAINTLVRPRVSVAEEDVRARYEASLRQSDEVHRVRLRHILVAVPQDADEATRKASRAKATTILERAKTGEPFETLAEEASDDATTKSTGGDLGWIERGTIATEWESIVFSMAQGDTRGPIQGPQGFHVFHVSEVESKKPESFEAVKEQLHNELYKIELDKQTQSWIEELRKTAHYETML